MEGLFSTFKQFNWVDILVVIIFIRMAYVSLRTGFSVELFKLSGTIFAIYFSLHYFTHLSDFFSSHLKKSPLEFLNFLFAVALVILGNLAFVILRVIFYRFIKMEAVPNLNKWGGFALGVARGIFVVGLVTFLLVISSIGYLNRSVRDSYSGKYFLRVAPALYSGLWNNFTAKFMTKEKFNQAVLDIQAGS